MRFSDSSCLNAQIASLGMPDVKWCNARSEKEDRPPVYRVNGEVYRAGREDDVVQTAVAGYRLPTSDEWEYAARGGLDRQAVPVGR